MNQLVRLASPAVRALVTAAGERASMRFLEPGAAHRLVVHYAARIEAGTRELAVSGAELEVRIHSAPAESPRTIGSCPTLQVRRRYPESFPLLHGHEFGHCAIEHGSIRKLGRSRACPARHGPITDDLKIRPPPAAAKLGRSLKRLPHRLDVSLPSQRF